ncbi:MAG: beta-ketoacyl-[acyl-carrier-protein] synthase family protein [Candidatus Omnitrophica bacterium]|nr:beta-ketoacyl-[acyl-carrier-protein] synthase family protein [Candidatus Omnitrophota bacterium]
MGVISACGKNISETLETFAAGNRNGAAVSLFKTELKYPVFEVKGLKVNDANIMRTLELAFVAVRQAVEDAALLDRLNDFRIGVCLGTTVASQLNDVDFYSRYIMKGNAPMHSVERYLKGNLAEAVGEKLGLHGPVCTVVNACSSGTDAIGVGLSWLRADLCDAVICGGADELNRVPFVGFGSLGVVSESLCKPFDKERSGLNLGEGAGVVVIEKQEIFRKLVKKAQIFIRGYGLGCDAYHLTAPRPDGSGLETALGRALDEAGIVPSEVAFVNAHGTATKDNDKVEGMVLAKVFGKKVKFLSTKSFTGHTLGAAGGLEAIFASLGLQQGWIPASAGFESIDEEIGIAPVSQRTGIKGNYAISTSLAFGGNNSVLVISRD